MSRRRRDVLRAAASGCIVAASASCWASEPPSYELDYVADASCPTREAFEQLVQSQLAEFGDASRTIQARAIVRFWRSTEGVVARFELERQDGRRSVRQLDSASCDEAGAALAFVLALALGGRDVNSDAEPGSANVPTAPASPLPSPPAATADRSLPSRELAPRASRPGWRWRFGLGVQLGARSGIAPTMAPVGAGFLALRAERNSPWGIRLRLGLLSSQPIEHTDGESTSSFKWLAGRVEGCPFSAALFAALTVTPCVSSHLGRLTVVGTPEALPGAAADRASKLWVEAGSLLRLELRVVRGLAIELQGEAFVPLTRYRFAFDNPDTTVYQVPWLASGLFLGLGAHFP